MTELLQHAADTLDDGGLPLSEGFLVEHDVTFDEACELATHLAAGARAMAWMLTNPEAARGAVNGAAVITARQALQAAVSYGAARAS